MSTLQQKSFVVVVSAGTNENVLFFVARHRSCSISFHLLYYLIRRRDETTRSVGNCFLLLSQASLQSNGFM